MFKKSTVYLLLVSLISQSQFSWAGDRETCWNFDKPDGHCDGGAGGNGGGGGEHGSGSGDSFGYGDLAGGDKSKGTQSSETELKTTLGLNNEWLQAEKEHQINETKKFYLKGTQEVTSEIMEMSNAIIAQAPHYFNTEVSKEISSYAKQALSTALGATEVVTNNHFRESYYLSVLAQKQIYALQKYMDSVVSGVTKAAENVTELVQAVYDSEFTQSVKYHVTEYFSGRIEAFTAYQKEIVRDLTVLSLCAMGNSQGLESLKLESASRILKDIMLVPLSTEGILLGESSAVLDSTLEGLEANKLISEEIGILNAEASKIVETGSRLGGFDAKALQASKKYVPELKAIRNEYNSDMAKITNTISEMKAAGKTSEEIATVAHGMRRESGIKGKELTPEEIRNFIFDRNIERYGDPLGPTLEKSVESAISKGLVGDEIWERVIETSVKPNQELNDFIKSLEEIK
jgi:hypothetical protein